MTSREVEKAVKEWKEKLEEAESENNLLREENRKLAGKVVVKEKIPDDYEQLKKSLEEAQNRISTLSRAQLETIQHRKIRESIIDLIREIGSQLAVITKNVMENTHNENIEEELKRLNDFFDHCKNIIQNKSIKGEIIDIEQYRY